MEDYASISLLKHQQNNDISTPILQINKASSSASVNLRSFNDEFNGLQNEVGYLIMKHSLHAEKKNPLCSNKG